MSREQHSPQPRQTLTQDVLSHHFLRLHRYAHKHHSGYIQWQQILAEMKGNDMTHNLPPRLKTTRSDGCNRWCPNSCPSGGALWIINAHLEGYDFASCMQQKRLRETETRHQRQALDTIEGAKYYPWCSYLNTSVGHSLILLLYMQPCLQTCKLRPAQAVKQHTVFRWQWLFQQFVADFTCFRNLEE